MDIKERDRLEREAQIEALGRPLINRVEAAFLSIKDLDCLIAARKARGLQR